MGASYDAWQDAQEQSELGKLLVETMEGLDELAGRFAGLRYDALQLRERLRQLFVAGGGEDPGASVTETEERRLLGDSPGWAWEMHDSLSNLPSWAGPFVSPEAAKMGAQSVWDELADLAERPRQPLTWQGSLAEASYEAAPGSRRGRVRFIVRAVWRGESEDAEDAAGPLAG